MRVLAVGWGYSPVFAGGVLLYIEDLLAALARRGHDVHYFCCGRSDLLLVPHLNTWSRNGIPIYELRNPPARVMPFGGTREPELDVDHPRVRRLFRGVLERVRPDVVHIHELLGLPAGIIEDVKKAGIRLVVTLEDLHGLCPTQLLYRRQTRQDCVDDEQGRGCVECCRHAPSEAGRMRLKSALWHAAGPLRERLPAVYGRLGRLAHSAIPANGASRSNGVGPASQGPGDDVLAGRFRDRRAALVSLLNQADVLHGISSVVCQLHSDYGVAADRMVRINTTLKDISTIRPVSRTPGLRLVFGYRGAFSEGKGALVLLEAFRGIPPDEAVLTVHGPLDPALQGPMREAEAEGWVRYGGPYSRAQLQEILDATDVGIIPSVWRETYGLVGREFLAAGIPVIATRSGGMADYVEHERNGLLIQPGDAMDLRRAVERFISDRSLLARLRSGILPFKTMDQHASEIEALYAC